MKVLPMSLSNRWVTWKYYPRVSQQVGYMEVLPMSTQQVGYMEVLPMSLSTGGLHGSFTYEYSTVG